MGGVTLKKICDDEEDMRLDRWFKEHYPELSFGHLQKLLRKGEVRLDGGRVKTNTRLKAGQTLRIAPLKLGEGERPLTLRHQDLAFLKQITLFEDDDVLVLNKPHGLAVQGGSGTVRHVDGLLEALRDRNGRKPRLVHRLDKDTSGVLIVAKKKSVAAALAESFRERDVSKMYWALTHGVPMPRRGRLSNYVQKITSEEADDRMVVSAHSSKNAQHSLTYYQTIETSGHRFAWLALKPVSGRTHQLRVHCQYMGHSILGDPKYLDEGGREVPGGMQNKLHLHARRLHIPHPKGGWIKVEAPLPPHMVQSFNLLGLDERSETAQNIAEEFFNMDMKR